MYRIEIRAAEGGDDAKRFAAELRSDDAILSDNIRGLEVIIATVSEPSGRQAVYVGPIRYSKEYMGPIR